jgi:two-component system probable response regulator PhcQ
MRRIMLVDDEPNILNALRRTLGTQVTDGHDVFEIHVEIFDRPEAALERAHDAKFDLVMTDYRMPGMDGVAFLKCFRALQPNAVRLILSGYADLAAVIGAINEAQIYRFINKPWQDYEVGATLTQALAFQSLLLENQRLADLVRVQQGKLSQQELELRRLEEETPGITQVKWGPDGSVLLYEEDF